ncbi:cytochrome b5 reductase 4-like isoform X2 [Dysidea avara]|uniref:cytochrome b5 reductase 4-like isoform X2 n=1 Tax=Dysidea avara TaxID=196820 RepID=UPI003333D13E
MAGRVAISEQKQQNRRGKLDAGKGLLGWIKLCRKYKQENNTSSQTVVITFEELRKHDMENDCWTAFRGVVYNVTHYLAFHPGGKSEVMKAAGIDCTSLFNQVHSHVNLSSILVTFKVGTLATFGPLSSSLYISEPFLHPGSPVAVRKLSTQMLKITTLNTTDCEDVADGANIASPVHNIDVNKIPATPTSSASSHHFNLDNEITNSLAIPETRSRRSSREQKDQPSVKYNWHQTETDVVITLNGQSLVFNVEDTILHINDCVFETIIFLGNWCYNMNIALEHPVNKSKVHLVGAELQIVLGKATNGIKWSNLGVLLPGNSTVTPRCTEKEGTQYMKCTLKSVNEVNHKTKTFIFKLPGASHMIIPTGHHVSIKAKQDGDWVERSYTPILPLTGDCNNEGSEVELMVKLYKNGAMSSILSSICIGDMIHVSFPMGSFTTSLLDSMDHVTLIAAGSGFTPMSKLIRRALKNTYRTNKLSVKLLLFNKTEDDIMWRDELKLLVEQDSKFTVVHILSHAGNSWIGQRGRIGRRVLQQHMHPANDGQLICVCGPTQFTHTTISTLLDMNYKENSIHAFE